MRPVERSAPRVQSSVSNNPTRHLRGGGSRLSSRHCVVILRPRSVNSVGGKFPKFVFRCQGSSEVCASRFSSLSAKWLRCDVFCLSSCKLRASEISFSCIGDTRTNLQGLIHKVICLHEVRRTTQGTPDPAPSNQIPADPLGLSPAINSNGVDPAREEPHRGGGPDLLT